MKSPCAVKADLRWRFALRDPYGNRRPAGRNGLFRISKPENDAKIRHVGSNLIWKMGFLTGITDLTAEILI
jgi:hypothetical protein